MVSERYSNPYVDYAERKADNDHMFALLREGDLEAFFVLASRYELDYVVAQEDGPDCCALGPIDHPRLRSALELEGLTVYELLDPVRP